MTSQGAEFCFTFEEEVAAGWSSTVGSRHRQRRHAQFHEWRVFLLWQPARTVSPLGIGFLRQDPDPFPLRFERRAAQIAPEAAHGKTPVFQFRGNAPGGEILEPHAVDGNPAVTFNDDSLIEKNQVFGIVKPLFEHQVRSRLPEARFDGVPAAAAAMAPAMRPGGHIQREKSPRLQGPMHPHEQPAPLLGRERAVIPVDEQGGGVSIELRQLQVILAAVFDRQLLLLGRLNGVGDRAAGIVDARHHQPASGQPGRVQAGAAAQIENGRPRR